MPFGDNYDITDYREAQFELSSMMWVLELSDDLSTITQTKYYLDEPGKEPFVVYLYRVDEWPE